MTTLATPSSISVPRKMIRSDSSRLNTSYDRSPCGVRSTTFGIVYVPIITAPSVGVEAAGRTSSSDSTTRSTIPYSLACSAVNQRSRSPSREIGLLGLAGVLGGDPLDGPLGELQVLRLDLDVGGGPADARRRLVHHDPRVRQREPLAGRADAEQELPHAGREAHGERRRRRWGSAASCRRWRARRHRTARAVDVEADVGARVLRRQQQQLRADPVRGDLVDLGAEHHDPLARGAARRDGRRSARAGCRPPRPAGEGRVPRPVVSGDMGPPVGRGAAAVAAVSTLATRPAAGGFSARGRFATAERPGQPPVTLLRAAA